MTTVDAIERPSSLTATVAERLRTSIVDGAIPLGSLLSEKSLAEHYGVSKTPVREALVQLQSMGLVTILPQRGAKVFHPDSEQVREICELRLTLESAGLRSSMARDHEGLAAALGSITDRMFECFDITRSKAYQQLDNAFHNAFFSRCGNSLLAEAYGMINPRISAVRTHLSTPQPYLLQRSLEEHRMMVDSIAKGDLEGTLEILEAHILRTTSATLDC